MKIINFIDPSEGIRKMLEHRGFRNSKKDPCKMYIFGEKGSNND